MIVYSVRVTIDPSIENDWLAWMKEVHIPDVLATGFFKDHTISKDLESPNTYIISYKCQSLTDLERYRTEYAPALQQHHTERFEGMFSAERSIVEELT